MSDLPDHNKTVDRNEAEEQTSSVPECGLYIIVSEIVDHDKKNFLLGQALHAANRFSTYAVNRHIVEFRPDPTSSQDLTEIARAYCTTVQRNGFIFLVFDNAQLARDVGADGVLCSSLKHCSNARKLLDENSIIGLRASTQAAAQSALSLDLDFVSFFSAPNGIPLTSLLNWWTTATEAPAAIEGAFDQESCAPFVAGGATFIDASHHIWTHPSGNPMQGAVNMLDAIERHGKKHPFPVN
ncbi:MAG: hypothetical protein AUJ12_06525 [Alphaproteobacteria bacterium CG1_02_46_17]|nr:MAG: hypothetical protein AUJ12_06525 [Alphaproteobacteria bacterium CG1_02_46_17]